MALSSIILAFSLFSSLVFALPKPLSARQTHVAETWQVPRLNMHMMSIGTGIPGNPPWAEDSKFDSTIDFDVLTCIPDASLMTTSSVRTIASVASIISNPGVFPGHLSPEKVSYMPPALSTHSPRPSTQLSTPAKAGIIAASVVVFFLLLLLVLEYTYLRRKRQDRALEQAIDEVERGTELKDATATESKEHMVLESRVEIVVVGEDGED
ncbi:hypothetical protein G6011_06993 [Alternaria panax]|uniref:Uncharacterized protein n=1 Tax=Alternaria panax TaxID=48097 RepID=A0AAD4F8W0_9PLEO|nr:hypothetical protein G6011_06993 [Alternaria panax]